MSDLLTIGASGLRAYSRALATVSDNIANAQSAGYARRAVRLEEMPAGGDNALHRAGVRPGGVVVTGVTRAIDDWLIEDARTALSEAGRTSSQLSWSQAAERAIDIGDENIAAKITDIFNRADQLTADPGNLALRSQFLGSVNDSANGFRQTSASLEAVSTGIAKEASNRVAQLNTDLSALDRVNAGLRRARAGSTNQAALLDERDRLLDSVAETVAVTAAADEHGAVSLRMDGTGGAIILSDTERAEFTAMTTAQGRLVISASTINVPTMIPLSGVITGLITAAEQVAGQRSRLDAIAVQFAAEINRAHHMGYDANGNPGADLLSVNGGAASVKAALLVASDVAASDAASSSGNMLAMSALRGSSGTEAALLGLLTSQSQMTASARSQDAAAATRRDGAFEARDAISAVDLDFEAAELLRFQQAYEGAARVIQMARETMQTILNVI
jgi:flagellar hook-associated protein 1